MSPLQDRSRSYTLAGQGRIRITAGVVYLVALLVVNRTSLTRVADIIYIT